MAASLTLCRAWIAAGMPRGSRIIGSFESWSAVMGGVLTVAGVPGFLGNVDEMLEAADAEGAIWRAFVAGWWASFRTRPVGVGDLYKIAVVSDPPMPLGDGNERSQKTKLGKALKRMRDRIFHVGSLALRIEFAGVLHQAQQWHLVCDNPGASNQHEKSPPKGNVPAPACNVPTHVPRLKMKQINRFGNVGNVGNLPPAMNLWKHQIHIATGILRINVPHVPNVPQVTVPPRI